MIYNIVSVSLYCSYTEYLDILRVLYLHILYISIFCVFFYAARRHSDRQQGCIYMYL